MAGWKVVFYGSKAAENHHTTNTMLDCRHIFSLHSQKGSFSQDMFLRTIEDNEGISWKKVRCTFVCLKKKKDF